MEKLAKYAKALAASLYLEVTAACDVSALMGVPTDDLRLEAGIRLMEDIKNIDDLVSEYENSNSKTS